MANLKDSFSKGITALNVKTNNFMEENKCKTYISTLENEVRDLKTQIGAAVYQKWEAGMSYAEEIEPLLIQIREKNAEIERQKKKIEQMQMEEKQILGSQSAPSPTGHKKYCSQCGAPNESNYRFCCKCGSPLS